MRLLEPVTIPLIYITLHKLFDETSKLAVESSFGITASCDGGSLIVIESNVHLLALPLNCRMPLIAKPVPTYPSHPTRIVGTHFLVAVTFRTRSDAQVDLPII